MKVNNKFNNILYKVAINHYIFDKMWKGNKMKSFDIVNRNNLSWKQENNWTDNKWSAMISQVEIWEFVYDPDACHDSVDTEVILYPSRVNLRAIRQ